MRATPSGWWMNSSPERRVWPACARSAALERAPQELLVDVRVVRLDLGDQLLDEVFVMPSGVENAHRISVLSGFPLLARREGGRAVPAKSDGP